MLPSWKTVRVFISSTFRDMQAERDHLIRFVFPLLREELLPARIHLVDIDLRWGITSEQDVSEICCKIVDECRPRFLCMLGGRYGFVPLGKDQSITAEEVHYGVLDRAQEERGFAFFYFRDENVTQTIVEDNPGDYREPQGNINLTRLDKLKKTIREEGLNPFTYTATWDNIRKRLIDLDEFGYHVHDDLLKSILTDDELMDRFITEYAVQIDEFDEENDAMEAFVEERCVRFVLGSREKVFTMLHEHAIGTGLNGYLMLTGEPGCGKSALMAYLARHLCLDSQPSIILISHFIGASPNSTSISFTLRRLCHELKRACSEITDEIPADLSLLWVTFSVFLRRACLEKSVLILLDGVDQFDPRGKSDILHWLPRDLPINARIIISTFDQQIVGDLRYYLNSPRELELKPLERMDSEEIIRHFLNRYNKHFEDVQRDDLLTKIDAGKPLFLLAALEELRTLGEYTEISKRITELPPTVDTFFGWILERLEKDDGFRDMSGNLIGNELVSEFSALLCSSRHGLTQSECINLLAPGNPDVNPPIKPDPIGNVAALLRLLRPYLMHHGELIDFYHGQFRVAAENRYLKTEPKRIEAHRRLSAYFKDLALKDGQLDWDAAPFRALSELPYQAIRLNYNRSTEDISAEDLLCNLIFIESSIIKGLLDQVIGDLDVASQMDIPDITVVRHAILLSITAIRQRPQIILQTLVNRIRNEHIGSILYGHVLAAESILDKRGIWLCSMSRLRSNQILPGVIAFSPQRNVLYVLTEKGPFNQIIECYALNSMRKIEIRDLFPAYKLMIHPLSGRIISMDVVGNIYNEGIRTPLCLKIHLRTRVTPFTFFYGGILGVDTNDNLVYFDLATNKTRILNVSVDSRYVKIFTNLDCSIAIVLSGDRKPGQRILLVMVKDDAICIEDWPEVGSTVTSACINIENSTVLLATMERKLMVFDISDRSLIQEVSFRIAEGKPVRGLVDQCRLITTRQRDYAIISTDAGELCVWNRSSGSIKRRGYFRGLKEPCDFHILEVLHHSDLFFVATDKQIKVMDIEGPEEFEEITPATQCSLSEDGWLICIDNTAKRISWLHKGLHRYNWTRPDIEPSSVAACQFNGLAFVGSRKGSVFKLFPGKEPEVDDAVDLFDQPIVSIVNLDDVRILAVSVNGLFKIVRFQPVQVLRRIDPIGPMRTEHFIRHLGKADDFVTCGRYKAGESIWSVVVIRTNDSREVVFETSDNIVDVATDFDGSTIYIVTSREVHRFKQKANVWSSDAHRTAEVTHAVGYNNDLLCVVVRDRGLSWIELWNTAGPEMETIVSMEMPLQVTTINNSTNAIAVGSIDGQYCFINIRRGGNE